jgi:molybdopterin-dependent oxidoreductase alpha subunit
MPIRGHSNVQGFGSMGVTVRLKTAIKQALEQLLGRSLNTNGGYDTRALIAAAQSGQVDTLFCLGGNLFAANPDLRQAQAALGQIETIFYVATKPNLGHFQGLGAVNTLLLPVFNRFENPTATTTESGNNFVRLNDPGKSHISAQEGMLISEVELITEIAARCLGDSPISWRKLQDTDYVRELIAKTVPGYEKIEEITQTQEEFTITGRIFTSPKFPTISGKAQMAVTPLPSLTLPTWEDFVDLKDKKGIALILGTGRSYGQHNTVVYNLADKYRSMPHRYCILMNREDIKQAGFQENDYVKVKGDAGELDNVQIIAGAIRTGTAFMFYPEANILFQAKIDPQSGTPAYKRVPIYVYT